MEISSRSEKDRDLLRKYLAGNCTPEERERVDAWYNSFDYAPLPTSAKETSSLQRIQQALLDELNEEQDSSTRVFPWSVVLRVAAVFFLFSSIALTLYLAMDARTPAVQEFHALNGEQKVITLADGSVVTLNAGSTLQVLSDFQDKTREVTLSGEAYFDVVRDASRPFIVSTGEIRTRVLGTSFDIQAYNNEGDLTVTVAEGKVRVDKAVGKNKHAVMSSGITPGQQLIYDKATHAAQIVTVDPDQISAWKKGVLYFNHESIAAIARRLERKFNIKIDVVGESRADCLYTLRLSDETLAKSLQLLTAVSGVTYTINQQDHLTLNTTACK
jgi:ferric-dicitrate binding protein FerR (iron transport regulator)